MLMTETEDGTCPRCGGTLLYGLKEEPTLWKVYFECDGCGREFLGGTVSCSAVDGTDDVHREAERMHERL